MKGSLPEGYSIRSFSDSDYRSLVQFWKRTNLWNPEREDTLETIRTTFLYQGIILLVEHIRDQLIATLWITCDGRRVHLHHFAVHPNHRRKGIGSKLVESAIHYAKEIDCQVRLDVEKTNIPARMLYRKFGFKSFSEYDIYVLRNEIGVDNR